MKNYFTEPKFKTFPKEHEKENKWYIWFRFNDHLIIRKAGINHIEDHSERLIEIKALCEIYAEKLNKGWIPNIKEELIQRVTIVDALNSAIRSIQYKISKNTYDAYYGSVKSLLSAIKDLGFGRMLATNFSRIYAKKSIEHIRQKRKWSNQSYNKNIGYLRSIFSEIIENEQAEINPFREIRNLKVEKTNANIPPTDEEMVSICNELKEKNYGFYVFYMHIYYCGIRPDSLIHLKIRDIDYENKMITLTKTKTGKKIVPMIGNIYNLLLPYQNANPDYYAFGTWIPNGGRHSQKNWFLPNPYKLKEDTPNKQWKKLIKDGLGIDKTLYSAKHKGADDKYSAGMSKQVICDIFGHSETKMTERYMHSLKNINLEEAKKVKLKIF